MKEKTKLEAALDELLTGKRTEEIVGPEGLLNLGGHPKSAIDGQLKSGQR